MSIKIPCNKCGELILEVTAKNNDGLCMPCKNGYRKNIEDAKAYYTREKELDKTCPFRALWRELVERVHHTELGFQGLTEEEKIYWSVNILVGEVNNGGFMQFFDNSSGDYFNYVEKGLIEFDAIKTLKIVYEAKKVIFGEKSVPVNTALRRKVTSKSEEWDKLAKLDGMFYEEPDDLHELLENYATTKKLTKV